MRKESVEKLVISEINNFRRISGLPLLNEGGKSDIARGAIRLIDDAFGITSKSLDKLASEVGDDAARLLKKLADPNDVTPITRIIDDLMSVNKTVGRNVYTQLRNHLDTIVDGTGKSLRDKLDEISANSKQMIQDGSTVDEAAEYFETETKRILDDSTADEELVSAITKYEKDVNRDWFPASTTSRTAGDTAGDTGIGETSTSTNINKTLDDVVNELSDEDAQKLFEYVMQKPWKLSFQNLMKRIRTLLLGGRKLQDETIKLIAALRKTEDVAKETALIEQIVKNVQELKSLEAKMYKQLNSWVEKYLKNAPDRDIRQLYNKLSQEEGWGKIKELDGFFKRMWGGAKAGFIDYGSHSRDLRNTWSKYMVRPFTLPVELIRLIKEGRNFQWLTKLSDDEKGAFINWFKTGSPSGWEKMGEIGKKLGYPGQITYGTVQLFRRWVSLKLMIGFFQTFIGAGILYIGQNDLLEKYPILDKFFGINPYEENSGTIAFFKNIADNANESEIGWVIPWIGLIFDLKNAISHLMRGNFESDLESAKQELDNVEEEIRQQASIPSTQLEYTVDAAKEVAHEEAKDYIWSNKNGDILLAALEKRVNDSGEEVEVEVDYPITLEDGVYMVEIPEGKIKLKEY